MLPCHRRYAAAWLIAFGAGAAADAQPPDARLKEVWYDPQAVVTVPVKRGVVTHVVLDASEAITDVGSGLGADCSKTESSWCVAAQPGSRHLFVKPKSTAVASNNLAVVTDKRTYALRFVVLPDGDTRQPVFRLSIKAPAPRSASVTAIGMHERLASAPLVAPLAPDQPPPLPLDLVGERLTAAPTVVNSHYSIAEGNASNGIVPTLVFDDGRFTYFRFPNNREVPAVFHVLGDGSETLVNARMEGELLVVDRVSRRLMLRAGAAVIGVWNEAFDLDGMPPHDGTTVSGVRRVLKAQRSANSGESHTGEGQ